MQLKNIATHGLYIGGRTRKPGEFTLSDPVSATVQKELEYFFNNNLLESVPFEEAIKDSVKPTGSGKKGGTRKSTGHTLANAKDQKITAPTPSEVKSPDVTASTPSEVKVTNAASVEDVPKLEDEKTGN